MLSYRYLSCLFAFKQHILCIAISIPDVVQTKIKMEFILSLLSVFLMTSIVLVKGFLEAQFQTNMFKINLTSDYIRGYMNRDDLLTPEDEGKIWSTFETNNQFLLLLSANRMPRYYNREGEAVMNLLEMHSCVAENLEALVTVGIDHWREHSTKYGMKNMLETFINHERQVIINNLNNTADDMFEFYRTFNPDAPEKHPCLMRRILKMNLTFPEFPVLMSSENEKVLNMSTLSTICMHTPCMYNEYPKFVTYDIERYPETKFSLSSVNNGGYFILKRNNTYIWNVYYNAPSSNGSIIPSNVTIYFDQDGDMSFRPVPGTHTISVKIIKLGQRFMFFTDDGATIGWNELQRIRNSLNPKSQWKHFGLKYKAWQPEIKEID